MPNRSYRYLVQRKGHRCTLLFFVFLEYLNSKRGNISPESKLYTSKEYLGGAMVLGKLLVPGRLTYLDLVEQGPTALAVYAVGDVNIFFFVYHFSLLFPSVSKRRPI